MENFSLSLNIHDWSILHDIATELKFGNPRALINDAINSFPHSFDEKFFRPCATIVKSRNLYDIPNKYLEFYTRLACRHTTSTSTIIFRYVVWPMIMNRLLNPPVENKIIPG